MMATVPDSTVSLLRSALLSARNADGGWPYYKGKASRLEATAAALLALGATGDLDPAGGLDHWPRRDGLFVGDGDGVNLAFNGVAALIVAGRPESEPARALAQALERSRGVKLPSSAINRQDDSIQAWAWTSDTFSWVEPTAWCLLGLKKLTPGGRTGSAAERFADGERFFADRVCRGGGWNHGNSNMLGKELAAYVPTTALGLLALHDRPDLPMVRDSLEFLERHRVTESGGLALALTRIALGVYDRPADDVDHAIQQEWHHSGFLGNLHVTALALYALAAGPSYEAFRV